MQGKTADADFDRRGSGGIDILLRTVVGVSADRHSFASGGGLDAAA